ncbi:glutamate-5-semialdehyde dehydrogenase [Kroppenstedtia eburnea]|nr:glutamate-5-semialdehyde dehydrogenase [Kroppenstedtia eburnea]QKI83742.1 glutamate-5-semialdehyde dehydrogenase [Kroppenstedtia eburnea]
MSQIEKQAAAARSASKRLAIASAEQKNESLQAIARALRNRKSRILEQNREDLAAGEKAGLSTALMDRLKLTEQRLEAMAAGLEVLTRLPDPVGEVLEVTDGEKNLRIEKIRVPLGVVGMIFEARPNVTVDASGLTLKSGNAVILRGSSSALCSNSVLVDVIREALADTSLPPEAVQLVTDPGRETVRELITCKGWIDVVIPRGGPGLIRRVVREATVPVLETGAGNCHIYVDRTADPGMAGNIVTNAKTDRPGVCNATETLLVHRDWAEKHLSKLCKELTLQQVEIRGCSRTRRVFPRAVPATATDWETEYLERVLAVKVVDSLGEAMDHIDRYGTGHSEAIITEDDAAARRFLQGVDAAAVYHNASTRFTDGSQFGMGAEIGISTQKLHARGPMGLRELTSHKYRIHGTGQIR